MKNYSTKLKESNQDKGSSLHAARVGIILATLSRPHPLPSPQKMNLLKYNHIQVDYFHFLYKHSGF